jgi:hypothetical protein
MSTASMLFAASGEYPIAASQDLRRIVNLPSREYTPEQIDALQTAWTEYLRTRTGMMRLKPAQAIALAELHAYRRLQAPIRVGGGKTLVTFLAPVVMGAKRPVLLVPAALVEKTRRDLQDASRDWRVPFNLHVMSYEYMGRESAAKELETRDPDLILADEAHKLKNRKAACMRRVQRQIKNNPSMVFVPLSGTLVKDGINDFAHLSAWSHKEHSPLPLNPNTVAEWAGALDEKVRPGKRRGLGALADAFGGHDVESVRRGFFERYTRTPGIVSTAGETLDVGIDIQPIGCELGPGAQQAFKQLRNWTNPDGIELADPMQAWALAGQLAMGFHYYLDPRPSDAWFITRSAWASYVRATLSKSRTYDTERQVRTVVQAEPAESVGAQLLAAWKKEEAAYEGVQRHKWHDSAMLDAAAKWIRDNPPALVWTWHSAFGRALAARAKVPYAGGKGLLDGDNTLVDDLMGARTVVLSTAANSTGRNLQAWAHNLVCAPPTTALLWEQLLGRTHRERQTADTVRVDVLIACREHLRAIARAHSASRMTNQLLGASQKLLLATWVATTVPHDTESYPYKPQEGGGLDALDDYAWSQ